MTIPLIILAIFSIVAGYIGLPTKWIDEWLAPIIPLHDPATFTAGHSTEVLLMFVSTAIALSAAFFAYITYKNLKVAAARKEQFAGLHKTLEHKWYVDEFYEVAFVKPIYRWSVALWKGFDVAVIDRLVLGFGQISLWSGRAARVVQTGSLQVYILMFVFGMVLTVGYLIYGLV